MEKLGVGFYCFHDRDVAPEGLGGKSLAETNKNLDAVVKVMKGEQDRTGIKLLWGTVPARRDSRTRATCTARRPARTPTRSRSPRRR